MLTKTDIGWSAKATVAWQCVMNRDELARCAPHKGIGIEAVWTWIWLINDHQFALTPGVEPQKARSGH